MKSEKQMQATGERYIPNSKQTFGHLQTRYEHLHRYAAAIQFVQNKDVLDLASGEGYGSAYLASTANSVTGVDIDPGVVVYASEKYRDFNNLKFMEGACHAVPIADSSVDVVVSFETLEHHNRHVEMMQEIKRVMRRDGLMIISSPNRKIYSNDTDTRNHFHVKELNLSEFASLLKDHFKQVTVYGQRLAVASFIYNLDGPGESAYRGYCSQGDDRIEGHMRPIGEPPYFIALCSDAPIQQSKNILSSVFTDSENDMYGILRTRAKERVAWVKKSRLWGTYKLLSKLKGHRRL